VEDQAGFWWFESIPGCRGVSKLNKENEKRGIGGVNNDFVLYLRPICEFLTFFKKVRVSPSVGIKVFKECGMLG